MSFNNIVQGQFHPAASIEVNQVLRKTYLLLACSLLFSVFATYFAMVTQARPVGILFFILGTLGLNYLAVALRDSRWGILAVFLYTGFLGYTLGPILNFYLQTYSNGSELVMTAFGLTALMFLGLSVYALVSKQDFSYMGGFIAVAMLGAFVLGIGAAVFNWPAVQILVSGAFALLSSTYLLYTTSSIIQGGERNYIMATISLYVSIFNLFLSLLRILAAFAGNRNN